MRSKRSKAWHLRKDIQRARTLIEHGFTDKDDRPRIEPVDPHFITLAHPSVEADLRAAMATGEIGSYESIRLVRVPK